MTLSEKMKALRKERKITQEQLANGIGVERSSIGKYETGTQPSTEIIGRIADYFCVSTDYLLGRTDTSKDIEMLPLKSHGDVSTELLADEEGSFRRHLINAISKLDNKQLNAVRDFMKSIIGDSENDMEV